MNELHKLNDYGSNIIESFIINEIEESIHIEFKASGALSKIPSKKKELSKDVSAFANSDGGIIIYGISEKDHKADGFSYIDGNEFSKEWLEQVISSSIKRAIPNIKIFPYRKDGKIEQTIYVVQIPSSPEAPHLSIDKRFYRRYNFESVPMEEYQIRELYGRKLKSSLELNGYSVKTLKPEDNKSSFFLFETGVFNTGEIVEKDYKINVYFDNFDKHININWRPDGVGRDYNYTELQKGKIIKISNSRLPAIYPSESINGIRFKFDIPNDKLISISNELIIRIVLFYSNGEDKLELNLKKLATEIINNIEDKKRR